MPTLIRLVIALVFIAGLGYAALFALTVMVDPGEKDITVRVPARDLTPPPAAGLPGLNPGLPAQAPVPVITSTPEDDNKAPLVQPGGPE